VPLEALLGKAPNRKPLRVVAFRQKSVRLECRECGLRFSIDPENLAETVARQKAPTPEKIEAQAREVAARDPRQYLTALASTKELAARFIAEQRNEILEPHRRGVAMAKPRKGQIRFPKRNARSDGKEDH
jgi:hypothetical protein